MQDEEQARKLAERLRTAQRIARMGFWDWNIQTGALFWSEEIFNIFGLAPDRFKATYEAFLDSVHPDDRASLQAAVDAAVNNKAEYKIEHRIVRPNGRVLHVSEQGVVSYDDSGKPARMLGTVIDITELKESENSRMQVEEEFRLLWESNFHAMITINTNNRITRVNQSAEATFGYAREELIGQDINILVPESLRPGHARLQLDYHRNPSRRALRQGLELEAQHKNGQILPVEISLSPFEYGGHREILVQVHDISERKQLENRLNQAKKLETLGRSISGLAHDLNNLLAVMYNSIELADIRLDKDRAKDQDLQRALRAGERARNMIDQMLSFTRQQNLQPKLIEVDEVIRDFRKILEPLLPEKIVLVLELNSQSGRARLDPEKFEQVIMNLVINARDAIEDQGQITIGSMVRQPCDCNSGAETAAENAPCLEVFVADSGSGMTEVELASIFEPFYTTKQPGQGTGLGLSSVYGIIKQSKGEIVVESQPGKGSRFRLQFPLVTVQSE